MDKIDSKIKETIVNELIKVPLIFGESTDSHDVLVFLNRLLPLKSMPSEDPRFGNAYEDCMQHIVNNDDWDIEYILIERFKIIHNDELFIKFLDLIVHPTTQSSTEKIESLVEIINRNFKSCSYRLNLDSYFEASPVYKFGNLVEGLPKEIAPNKVPFYVDMDNFEEYPCFKLKSIAWNDYSIETKFQLFFWNSDKVKNVIGIIKIMKVGEMITKKVIDNVFISLDSSYCSLGQGYSFYYNLECAVGKNYSSVLLALRDCANFPKIYDNFENDDIFKTSLLRDNTAEQNSRNIKYLMAGISEKEYYKFEFKYLSSFIDNEVSLKFDFEYGDILEHRVFAVIGKNGCGKTTLLSKLADELGKKESECFVPRRPHYGKIFAISYSYFDSFNVPESSLIFNYEYCGLRKNANDFMNEDDLFSQFIQSANRIIEKNLFDEWKQIISEFLPNDFCDCIKEIKHDVSGKRKFKFDIQSFRNEKSSLSSGESILLYSMSKLISSIRYDSLILFDEPETHLHPNAISALISCIYKLSKSFKSYFIIATHSPVIIQQIPARNIIVLEKEGKYLRTRKLELESFGQNLTLINNEVFGAREVPEYFQKKISRLVDAGKSFDDIERLIKSDNLPLSNGIRLFIKLQIEIKNEKS